MSKLETIKFNRAIKYQIYPNEQQVEQLVQTFGCVRKVYNLGLELQQGLYQSDMSPMSKNSLNNYCNRYWKKELPYLQNADKFALTNSLYALDAAFQKFFAKKAGYPKFKSKRNRCDSYTTNSTNNNIEIAFPAKSKSCKGKVKLPKLGWVDACIYRKPKKGWVIKQATISCNMRGKYFVSILFEYYEEVSVTVPIYEKTLGLDYSSPKFYVDNNNCSPEIPHWYRKMEQQLAREQRRLSRMVKGSHNYEQQRLRVSKLNEKAAAQRKDFCHKQSRKIANSCEAVCVEDLDLRALSGSLHLGKATMDNGFGTFRTFLKYKLEEQGKHFVVSDKWYPSTKTCNQCGGYNPEVVLGQDEWICPHCGELIKRDLNAARNIRDEGYRVLMQKLA